MDENQKGFDEYLEKLALISEGVDSLHNGKKAVVFELEVEEFMNIRKGLKNLPEDKEEFKIDISGIEFIYLLKK